MDDVQAGERLEYKLSESSVHAALRPRTRGSGDLLTLQRILGRSSLEVVKVYVNLDTRDLLAQQWTHSPVDTLRARRATKSD